MTVRETGAAAGAGGAGLRTATPLSHYPDPAQSAKDKETHFVAFKQKLM